MLITGSRPDISLYGLGETRREGNDSLLAPFAVDENMILINLFGQKRSRFFAADSGIEGHRQNRLVPRILKIRMREVVDYVLDLLLVEGNDLHSRLLHVLNVLSEQTANVALVIDVRAECPHDAQNVVDVLRPCAMFLLVQEMRF